MPHRIALVTPWFGNRNGGAEVFCAGLAQALIAAGRPVEVLTTCCRNPFHDWSENHLPQGEGEVDGVPVRRFPVRPRDTSTYAHLYGMLMRDGSLTPEQEEELLRNSINSDELCHFIAAHRRDYLFFFLPYLYGTTYFGIQESLPENAFLIPCLHNEAFAYLGLMQRMFRSVRGCLFLSPPEQDFASALYGLRDVEKCVMGGGIGREAPGRAEDFRSRTGIRNPFLLYVGRKVAGKGADLLLQCYSEYTALFPQEEELHLVLIGSGDLAIPPALEQRVHSLGAETAQEVYDAMAACEIFVQPSFLESFSIVLMEAWLHRRPVLVNGQCEVTTYHALTSNGGLHFSDFAEFAECLRLLRANPVLLPQLGENGRRYVLENYLWPETVGRLQEFLHRIEENDGVKHGAPPAADVLP